MRFEHVAIVGVGLLGGSLGLALKARGLAGHVCGVGRNPSTLETALKLGAIDSASLEIAQAAREADLIVLCTPAATISKFMDRVLQACKPECIVTDVASTKAGISAHAKATWPAPVRFIGSHPMAGSEKYGPEHSYPELYEGCVTIVESGGHLDKLAQGAVAELWQSVGAEVVEMDPVLHDRLVAHTSHMPHLVAAAVAVAAARAGENNGLMRKVVGNGFRDATRIAESRPEIWRDICLTNREAILEALDAVAGQIQQAREALESADSAALDRFFEAGGDARREVLGS